MHLKGEKNYVRFRYFQNNLEHIPKLNNTTTEECLALSYEEIKDRKGKLINGVFVKEADL